MAARAVNIKDGALNQNGNCIALLWEYSWELWDKLINQALCSVCWATSEHAPWREPFGWCEQKNTGIRIPVRDRHQDLQTRAIFFFYIYSAWIRPPMDFGIKIRVFRISKEEPAAWMLQMTVKYIAADILSSEVPELFMRNTCHFAIRISPSTTLSHDASAVWPSLKTLQKILLKQIIAWCFLANVNGNHKYFLMLFFNYFHKSVRELYSLWHLKP